MATEEKLHWGLNLYFLWQDDTLGRLRAQINLAGDIVS